MGRIENNRYISLHFIHSQDVNKVMEQRQILHLLHLIGLNMFKCVLLAPQQANGLEGI